jgi:LuxR family maltose regulon positive regulatory protein
VTAVTGAAGSGKTVLVSSWVRAGLAPGPVAWLTLDAADNVPGAFWSYVLEALQLRTPGVDDLIGTSPQASTFSRAFLGRIAMSLAETPQPAVLVLDRCEHITNRAIAADLDLLLRYSTPGLRLVVVGRSARLLPLHRYQLAGELTEIDNASLTLRPDEATALLESHGLQLTEDEGDALLASTQGWMTGICLHALTPHPGRRDTAGASDPTDHHAVGNYLRTEVLYGQAPRTRDLLLRTSILDEIHPSLADRMTGRYDAHGIFEELVRANAFVQPLGESWYRVHPLFRELLHDELTARHPDLVRRLHGLAAHWYADRGRVTDALRHAARVDEWDYAATLAVDRLGVSRLLTGSDAEELRAIFARLPGDQPSGAAALVRATLALARFDTTAARTELDLAQSPAPGEPDDRQVHFRLAITVLEMVLARLSGDTAAAERAADDAKEHWNRISPADLPDGPRIRAMLLSNLGVAQLWAGDHAAARGSLGRVAAAVEPATEYSVHDALGHLALAELVEGKLHRADKYAREALAVAEAAGLRPAAQVGAANVAMAAVALEWNDLPAVRERLSRAIAAPGSRHDPATATIIALLRAYAAISRRDGRRALAAVQGARAKLENWHVPAAVWEQLDLATAQAYLASGDLVAARETLGSVPDSPQRTLLLAQAHLLADEPAEAGRQLEALPTHPARPAILQDAALLRAQLAAGAGDATAAEQELRKALELARPEQRRRPFAEAGDLVQRLLRQHPDIVAEHTWLSPQLGPPGRRPATEPSVVVEQLTAREIEVLRRLARALSTDDIARDLYLSVNTVKTHLKSIYRKLGTSGRSATARRARELRLIDDSDPDPPPSPDAG